MIFSTSFVSSIDQEEEQNQNLTTHRRVKRSQSESLSSKTSERHYQANQLLQLLKYQKAIGEQEPLQGYDFSGKNKYSFKIAPLKSGIAFIPESERQKNRIQQSIKNADYYKINNLSNNEIIKKITKEQKQIKLALKKGRENNLLLRESQQEYEKFLDKYQYRQSKSITNVYDHQVNNNTNSPDGGKIQNKITESFDIKYRYARQINSVPINLRENKDIKKSKKTMTLKKQIATSRQKKQISFNEDVKVYEVENWSVYNLGIDQMIYYLNKCYQQESTQILTQLKQQKGILKAKTITSQNNSKNAQSDQSQEKIIKQNQNQQNCGSGNFFSRFFKKLLSKQ